MNLLHRLRQGAIRALVLATIPTSAAFGQCTLNGASNPCQLYGPLTVSSGYTGPAGTATQSYGTITNNSTIQFSASGGSAAILGLIGNTTLTGGGTLTLATDGASNSNAAIADAVFAGGNSLINANNTIQGVGFIGYNSDLTFTNQANGTVNANVAGTTLFLDGGPVTNAGLMEATNTGSLLILNSVNNAGGTIAGIGSGVSVGSTIAGGTLTTSSGGLIQTYGTATLDGASQGTLTLSTGTNYSAGAGANTTILGTINNQGNIAVNGGSGSNTALAVEGATTLQGGGTLTLGNSGGAGTAVISDATFGGGAVLTNTNHTIQGYGNIGNSDLTLINTSTGTVNANVSGTGINLNAGGGVTNAGLLEATNGAGLGLATTVNNLNGNITAGSGGTVYVSAAIQGGTLNTSSGGLIQTYGTATLDGASQGTLTLSTGSNYSAGAGTATTILGTINNQGNIAVNGGGGSNAVLGVEGATTLQGGGTLTLGNSGGTGTAVIADATFGGGAVLTNTNHTIQGYGNIGNSDLTLINTSTGTVNANVSGTGINLNAGGGVTNAGLLEATNGAGLGLATTINNMNGNITAGAGSTVYITGTIQGGTLNGAGLQLSGGSNTVIDGATHGALTLSSGSTLTAVVGSSTGVFGTINNQGNIQINASGGQNTTLQLIGSTTLQGGGTLTLSSAPGSGALVTETFDAAFTLNNVNNTIQGGGNLGSSGLSIVNGAAGTLLANVPGGALSIFGGGLTNNGVMQADAGSALVAVSSLTNFSGNTLTGGAYNVYGTLASGGDIQLDSVGGGASEIVNNAATIMLNGPNSEIEDVNGANALSAFVNNLSAGSFSILGGQNFTASGAFENSGLVDIGTGDIFTVAASAAYTQAAGITQVDGDLTASSVNVDGGTLKGAGTVTGNVSVDTGGIVAPGDSPGILTVTGNYGQTSAGMLDIVVGGATAGSQYSVLDAEGTVNLSGTLNLSSLNGFNPYAGEMFDIIDFASGAETGTFSNATWANLTPGLDFSVIYNATDVVVDVTGASSATPEPGTLLLLGGALCVMSGIRFRWGRKA